MKHLQRLRQGLARLPIGRQLFAAFTVVLLLTAAVGTVSLNGLARVQASSEALSSKWLRSVGLLADIRTALVETRDFEVKHSRTTDRSYQSEYEEKLGALAKIVDTEWAQYRALPAQADQTVLGAKLEKSLANYRKALGRVVALGREKKQQDAADISDGASIMAFDETLGALAQLTKHDFAAGDEAARAGSAVHVQSTRAVVGLLSCTLVIGLVLSFAITRHLVRQLGGEPAQAAELARSVASGDLTMEIQTRAGDTESLMASLQAMQHGLARAVSEVRLGSENVATASAEIAQGNQDLSDRTEQQASALQQTAATMDQLGATVRDNADNAQQANQLARGASEVAVKGGAVVGQVVETMRGINDSSRKIADIIGVIDGIAFQTNILALNAAVEAARAGEQGRGFAVVASEVRSLAQRSAEAAKQIKVLIDASVQRVTHGTTLVDEAGRTMEEIVSAIQRVSAIVGEISEASSKQSSGVAQVGEAVTQMDEATQQNAALVEQSAAAAQSMSEQARQLVGVVAAFRLRDNASDATALR